MHKRIAITLAISALLVLSCSASVSSSGAPKIVASTSIIADVVSQIAGDIFEVISLIPPGSDPHSYEVTPQDIVHIERASLIFLNGIGLEGFLDQLNTTENEQVISLSSTLDIIEVPHTENEDHADGDPHVWMDPENVKIWADQITNALSKADPENADLYAESNQRYQQSLADLLLWADQEISTIPVADRILVTEHDSLAYFARRFDFEILGTVIPGFSSLSDPSAAELALLEDLIAVHSPPAIFIGLEQNPQLVERLASDTGVEIVTLYTGALSELSGPASSYLDLMRYDIEQIVGALQKP